MSEAVDCYYEVFEVARPNEEVRVHIEAADGETTTTTGTVADDGHFTIRCAECHFDYRADAPSQDAAVARAIEKHAKDGPCLCVRAKQRSLEAQAAQS